MSQQRTHAQIQHHYDVEKALASRLRQANAQERGALYTEVYNELFRKVPDHSLLVRKIEPERKKRGVARHLRLLCHFLPTHGTYLEVGPGDCSLTIAIAPHVKKAYAVDVSTELTKRDDLPENVDLLISDGISINAPKASIDVAFSNQLMEHLHPDDAAAQLENLHRAIAPSGIYICMTPHRMTGPHDISRNFDTVATGLHLKEYTYRELLEMFRQAGFSQFSTFVRIGNFYLYLPLWTATLPEWLAGQLPAGWARRTFRNVIAKRLMGIRLIARTAEPL